MEKLSDYISKKIISIEQGAIIGYVLDVNFDDELKMLEEFIIVDEESEQTFSLSISDILSKSEECLVISSSQVLSVSLSLITNNPIGKPVYDKNGVNLGIVKDVLLNQNNLKKLITSKCEIPSRYIKKAGDNCIIYGNRSKKLKKYDFKVKNAENLPKVQIESQIIDLSIKKKNNNLQISPIRLFANVNSLLGKVITADIFGFNNEIIAKKYDKINQNLINKAKLHNKINYLFIYSE